MTNDDILEWLMRWGTEWVSFYDANETATYLFKDAAYECLLEYDGDYLRLTQKAIRRLK